MFCKSDLRVYKEGYVSPCMFFICSHIVAPISTKFGMTVENLSVEVLVISEP
jgi:hypothetical protein